MHIEYIAFIPTTEPKLFRFDLPKDADNNLANEIDSIIKCNERLAEHTIKKKFKQLFPNIRMETIFMNTKNSKANEPQKYVLN